MYTCTQLRERLSLMKVAEAEEEEKRRKDILSAKQVCALCTIYLPHCTYVCCYYPVCTCAHEGWRDWCVCQDVCVFVDTKISSLSETG